MIDEINKIKSEALSELDIVANIAELENFRIKYLGKKGKITLASKSISDVDKSEKRSVGLAINEVLKIVNDNFDLKYSNLGFVSDTIVDIDTSLPGIRPSVGHMHPTSKILREINSFFRYYGYSVYEGPEIESNEYNFEKLNLPKDHPARGLADTLFVNEPNIMLRTHTSSVETRAMTNEDLPLRIVVPGKVFRNETTNATNNSMFYQYEGLVVDKNVSMAELKATLNKFIKFLYGDETKTRFRCKYYPQVEPGAGLDIQCLFCKGKGCTVCKFRGWVEVLGCGMVHPNVLRSCGIDHKKWSGFAFGMGLDRIVMLKYGIDDIRKLYSGELVFED